MGAEGRPRFFPDPPVADARFVRRRTRGRQVKRMTWARSGRPGGRSTREVAVPARDASAPRSAPGRRGRSPTRLRSVPSPRAGSPCRRERRRARARGPVPGDRRNPRPPASPLESWSRAGPEAPRTPRGDRAPDRPPGRGGNAPTRPRPPPFKPSAGAVCRIPRPETFGSVPHIAMSVRMASPPRNLPAPPESGTSSERWTTRGNSCSVASAGVLLAMVAWTRTASLPSRSNWAPEPPAKIS